MDAMAAETSASKRRPPASLFALGASSMPAKIDVGGRPYDFTQLFKHDFFAATGLYQAAANGIDTDPRAPPLVVLKIQRVKSFYGFPMAWLGRFICNHESEIYAKLQGIRGIPTMLGSFGPTGMVHEYIPGRILDPAHSLSLEFFDQLQQLIAEIHARGIAYVDTNKRENILVGDDGQPYLIDFQISWNTFRWARRYRWAQWALRKLQDADWYHFFKHKTRLAPKLCTPEEFALAKERSWYLRLHRRVAWPVISTRRRLMSRYDLDKTR
jgi:hypothetical protein